MPQRPVGASEQDERMKGVERTGDQIHRNEHGTQSSKLGKHVVDLVVRVRHLDGDLGEIV